MNSEIQRVTLTVSNSSLKQSRSVSTSVTSALEVNFNNMHYINIPFTLLYLLYTTQYEFIAASGQTTTSAFYYVM